MENKIRHDILSSYTEQLARIYTEIKNKELSVKDKIQLYINSEKGLLKVVFNKQEAKDMRALGFSHLNEKTFKNLFKDFNAEGIDAKVQRAAAKALLHFPWKRKIGEDLVISSFPMILDDSSQIKMKKAEALHAMLNEILTLTRSHEGGNGVFFIKCMENDKNDSFPDARVLVKFMKKEAAERTVIGDRFLKKMGFTTPGSKRESRQGTLGNKIAEVILANLDHIKEELHPQIKKQADAMDSILIMTQVPGLTLRQISEPDFLELMDNEKFLMKLGEMIFFDAFMGNQDRLTENSCNLGNIMVNLHDSSLTLIDHEFCLSSSAKDVAIPLIQLLKGAKTEKILLNLKGALQFDRKDLGGIKLEEKKLDFMKNCINRGIHQGATRLQDILSNQSQVRHLFQFPSRIEQQEKACILIKQLRKYIKP